MRSSDCDILMVPGLGGSGPDHWQTRWEARLSTASRIEQADWDRPDRQDWEARIVAAVARATRPVVLVAHSLGVVACVLAAPTCPAGIVRGAFLVALPDVEDAAAVPSEVRGFAPLPHDPLPFPALLVASRDDPFCAYERADEMAHAWGAALVDAGASGHINTASGHGPWPEGLMRFAGFLKGLGEGSPVGTPNPSWPGLSRPPRYDQALRLPILGEVRPVPIGVTETSPVMTGFGSDGEVDRRQARPPIPARR